jgi:Tfp pilus assembly protein PilF
VQESFAMRETGSATEEALRGEAVELMRRALALGPGTPEAVNMLATAAMEGSLPEFAEEILRGVLREHPGEAASLHLLGCALRDQCRYEEAVAALRGAVAMKGDVATFHVSLGDALRRQGVLGESVRHCERALALEPENAHGHFTRGNTLYQLGRFDGALAAYRRALAIDPMHAGAHRNAGVSHFLRGDFAGGYDDYEWRWKLRGFRGTLEGLGRPMWNGEALAGRTLLVHAEQGLGDTVQFVRYVPRIVKDGGRIVLQVRRSLVRLMKRVAGVDEVVVRGEALPGFDVHCPMLSLPRVFGTTVGTIPNGVPYLEPSASCERGAVTPGKPGALSVGVTWMGNSRFTENRLRSIAFQDFATLFDVPGVCFYRLHTRDGGETAACVHPNLADPTEKFTDLAETAKFVRTLDLVISVDTVVAHLAGAMGKPVWTLVSFAPDWRWMLGRSDSPWYPTMRLFRQEAPGEWGSVLTQVKAMLETQHR